MTTADAAGREKLLHHLLKCENHHLLSVSALSAAGSALAKTILFIWRQLNVCAARQRIAIVSSTRACFRRGAYIVVAAM